MNKPVPVRFDDDDKESLEKLAGSTGISQVELIRRAVKLYLKQVETQGREFIFDAHDYSSGISRDYSENCEIEVSEDLEITIDLIYQEIGLDARQILSRSARLGVHELLRHYCDMNWFLGASSEKFEPSANFLKPDGNIKYVSRVDLEDLGGDTPPLLAEGTTEYRAEPRGQKPDRKEGK